MRLFILHCNLEHFYNLKKKKYLFLLKIENRYFGPHLALNDPENSPANLAMMVDIPTEFDYNRATVQKLSRHIEI